MSRFQPHVSRDRDTSKGKSDFANVLTEGWANIFEPFVPVVCTVTSSEGGVCRGATSRPHFFPSFFSLSLFFLFFTRWKNNGEQRVRKTMRALCVGMRERRLKNVRCRRWKTRGMKLLFHLISGEMAILIAPRSDELKNSVSKIHYSSTSGWPVEKKKRKKMKQPLWKNLVKIDGIVRNEERDVSIMKRVKWIIWLLNVRNQENQGVIVKNWRRFEKWLKMK